MNIVKVAGKKARHKVLLYSLSICIHCQETKQYLTESDVEYEYVDVDLCNPKDKQEILRDILNRRSEQEIQSDNLKRRSEFAFPKIIIDGDITITGFDKDRIKKALEI